MIVCAMGAKGPISKCFPDEQLCEVQSAPWHVDIVNCLVTRMILET